MSHNLHRRRCGGYLLAEVEETTNRRRCGEYLLVEVEETGLVYILNLNSDGLASWTGNAIVSVWLSSSSLSK
ncbi:hypothetical protein CARUB_v10002388mg [Capsella rubella]|uniref:Uncharacterized protein n=1 Tax=Capsella rubella TaxID=81985 RepID=R0FIN3_9BRAS|nr:hypothetical protein CARUB_v10002388mg [Capsella rubella]